MVEDFNYGSDCGSHVYTNEERPYSYHSLYAEQPRTILNDILAPLNQMRGLISLDLQDVFSDLNLDRSGSTQSICQESSSFTHKLATFVLTFSIMHITNHRVQQGGIGRAEQHFICPSSDYSVHY